MTIEAIKFEKAPPLLAGLQNNSGELTYAWRPREATFQTVFKAVWLCGWTVAGYVAFTQAKSTADFNGRAFLIFWLMAWSIGWTYSIYQLVWILLGSQTAIANSQALTIASRIGPFARKRYYRPDQISRFRWTESRSTRQLNSATNPIRQPSGVNFDYGSKTIKILDGIDEPEAEALISRFREVLQIKRASE
ncbi:hypothetical protein ABID16_000216 [Rhizobium aquaticum]|uniref:DUF304 domain-containing protein n=1 Tax=Rhizobium aquaticum TaxID=1549636 RepID=A0ABV2IU23_9HYPH